VTVVLTINVTGRPKRDIIEMAREFAGLAGFEFGSEAEEIASHLRELDTMMAEWPWDGLGYDPATYGSGLPEDLSGIPADAVGAVSKHLGLRIAPGLGATLSAEAKAQLARAYGAICSKYGGSPPTMPLAQLTVRGSGARRMEPFVSETIEG
jgi:tail accessory factor